MDLTPDGTTNNPDIESTEENGKGLESLILTPDAGRHGLGHIETCCMDLGAREKMTVYVGHLRSPYR